MSELADRVAAELAASSPQVIGIGGPVAVGKSTIAATLGAELERRGRRVVIVATDSFLLSNAELSKRDLMYKKGFPESFDAGAIESFLLAVRRGDGRIEVPVYSHQIYDVVPGERIVLSEPDVVIIEGVAALQPPAVELLDVAIYVDAREEDVRRWFVDRFLDLTAAAHNDDASFYKRFSDMDADAVRRLAEGTWDAINGVNLHEHIAPTRSRATIVIEKARDHSARVA